MAHKLNRRNFLRKSSLSAMGAGLVVNRSLGNEIPAPDEKPRIREYHTFGKTGFQVSDISSGNPTKEAVLRALLDSGVNLIDTGETYYNGNSERLVGRVIKDFDRKKLFINTKLYTETEFPSKDEVLKRAYASLERLETDYVDCMQIHSAENRKILKDENFHGAMEQLKKEGRVRSIGVSCHGSNWAIDTEENLETILLEAVNDGRFDVMLLAYNFANAPMAEKVLNACEQKNIATIIMKSNPVALYSFIEPRVHKLQEEGKAVDKYLQMFYDKYKVMNEKAQTFFDAYQVTGEQEIRDAASKYVLSNPQAHTTIWDFKNFDEVQHMLGLSGQKLTARDQALLEGYEDYFGSVTCRIGCNDCEKACPHDLPVNRILRYNYYFTAKGQEKRAMDKFAQLSTGKPADVCRDCPGFCEEACQYGVSTRYLLAEAQNNLGWKVS